MNTPNLSHCAAHPDKVVGIFCGADDYGGILVRYIADLLQRRESLLRNAAALQAKINKLTL